MQKKRTKRIFRVSLALLILVFYASEHLWLLSENAWSPRTALPLQLSDLAVILAIIMLLSISCKLFQFIYFAGLASSLQAIVTPDLGSSVSLFRYIEFFVVHSGVVIASLFMVAAYKYQPTIRALWGTFIIVNLYAGGVFLLNQRLGSNYLYLMKKPGAASLLDLFGPWPRYLIFMELALIVSFYILYTPFWLKRKIEN